MLRKEYILKEIKIHTREWDEIRLGRFTSSKMVSLVGEKWPTQTALQYVDQKVGEELTGKSTAEDEILDDENTQWGNEYEPHGLQKFKEIKHIEFLVTQRVICNPATRFSSTPDGIWVLNVSLSGLEYNVSTVEMKCPRKYHRYGMFFRCKTPHDLKRVQASYFWQVIDQMDNCDAALGYFAVYHPLYPEGGNMRIIEFNKMDLWNEFKLLKERKKLAAELFEEFRKEYLGL